MTQYYGIVANTTLNSIFFPNRANLCLKLIETFNNLIKITGKQKCYFKLLRMSHDCIPHTAYIGSIPELLISGTNVLCTRVPKGRAEVLTVTLLTCDTFASWLLKKPTKYQSKKQGKLQVHSIRLWTKINSQVQLFLIE